MHEQGWTFEKIHEQTNIPVRTLKYRSKVEKWKKGSLAPDLHAAKVKAATKEFAKYGIDAARVMAELTPIGLSNIQDFLEWDGSRMAVKPFAKIPRAMAGAISELSTTKDGIKIKFHSKLDALGKIGSELGMFGGDTEKAVEAGIFAFYRTQLAERRGKR